MARVFVRKGESLEGALKRFNRQVEEECIFSEIKKREFYESRGQKERRKKKENIINCKRNANM